MIEPTAFEAFLDDVQKLLGPGSETEVDDTIGRIRFVYLFAPHIDYDLMVILEQDAGITVGDDFDYRVIYVDEPGGYREVLDVIARMLDQGFYAYRWWGFSAAGLGSPSARVSRSKGVTVYPPAPPV